MKNNTAIFVAAVLIFFARTFEFQSADYSTSAFIAVIFGGISWALDNVLTRVANPRGAVGLSAAWTPRLLFGWIVSLIIVIADSLANTYAYTKSFPQFFASIWAAAFAYSVLAVAVTFVKTYKFNQKAIVSPVAFAIVAVLLNSLMLYVFVFV
jgi:hypothetical protein